MSSIGNNTNGKYSQLRTAFFGTYDLHDKEHANGEVEFLEEILTNYPKARELYEKFRTMPAEKLYNAAVKRIDMIDNGQVNPNDLSRVEGEIALLLAAIEDLEHVRELYRTPTPPPTRKNDDAEMER